MNTCCAHRKPVIGILGAPGSGKSFVARQFGELGGFVIDADAIAKEQLRDPQVIQMLVAWWGGGVLTPDGQIDRAAV